MTANQKIYIMAGVPEPARNRNAVESVVRIEPTIATSDLNQRFSNNIMKKPATAPMMMDGNLIEYKESPKIETLAFCNK